jgi:hypothetical protein
VGCCSAGQEKEQQQIRIGGRCWSGISDTRREWITGPFFPSATHFAHRRFARDYVWFSHDAGRWGEGINRDYDFEASRQVGARSDCEVHSGVGCREFDGGLGAAWGSHTIEGTRTANGARVVPEDLANGVEAEG